MTEENYIRVYEDVLTEEDCQRVIDAFEKSITGPEVIDNKQVYGGSGVIRNDLAIFFDERWPQAHSEIHERLRAHVTNYVKEFPIIDSMPIGSMHTKVQRTMPGGGYHTWHCEHNNQMHTRVLVWVLYLNEVEGGETEFLNQNLRVAPKPGRLVLFPAYWPWAHRGNPPLSGAKYIATGWFNSHG